MLRTVLLKTCGLVFLGVFLLFSSAASLQAQKINATDIGVIEEAVQVISQDYIEKVELRDLYQGLISGTEDFMAEKKEPDCDLSKIVLSGSLHEDILSLEKCFNKILATGKASRRELNDAALKGLIAALHEPQCRYLSPEDYDKDFGTDPHKIGGTGMYVTEEKDADGFYVVICTLDGFPAQKSGILPGDRIVEVEGESVKGWEYEALGRKIRGMIGTRVKVSLERRGAAPPITVTLERVWINPNPKTLYFSMLDSRTGYIYPAYLGDRVEFEIGDVIAGLKAKGMKRLVMDVRNSAGSIEGPVKLCQKLIPADKRIVTKITRAGRMIYKSEGGNYSDLPLVVLINENTSRSGMILAAILKEQGRARIVGMPSTAKMKVEEVLPLNDGSALKIVTSYYRLSEGKIFEKETVKPDLEVPMDPFIPFESKEDIQLKKALEAF
ncbi:MAG: S41 family peptidase [bacterium]